MKKQDNSSFVGKKSMKAVVILAGLAVMTACGPSESEDESMVPAPAADEAEAPAPAMDDAGDEAQEVAPPSVDETQGRDPTTGAPG